MKQTADITLSNYIAVNIRVLRKAAGWSQTELAERVNLNRGNIASYESGAAEPSICKLLRISNLFSVTSQDITRRDLSQPGELALARHAHMEAQTAHNNFAAYRNRLQQLAGLVEAGHQLHTYKRETLASPCREAEVFALQYQQLYDLTRQLLKEHGSLLEEVGCHPVSDESGS